MMVATGEDDPLVFKGRKFYRGDRVMQTVNNYDKDVYNGNMGYIAEIDATPCENYKVMVRVEMLAAGGTFFVDYFDEQIEQLKLCWCSSVHKFQGSQVDNVLMVMASGQRCMMSRELAYTGMTRASKTLRVVGPPWILGTAARNQAITKRYTHTEKLVRMAMGEEIESLRVRNLELCREGATRSA
jgi:exodeoxyribonuclease V alpha subunit